MHLYEKDVVIFGEGDDSFEIWGAEQWASYEDETDANFDDIADGLVDLGF